MKKEILKTKYLAKLDEIQNSEDIEVRHIREDDLLCELLIGLGFKDIVDKYNSSNKWYS